MNPRRRCCGALAAGLLLAAPAAALAEEEAPAPAPAAEESPWHRRISTPRFPYLDASRLPIGGFRGAGYPAQMLFNMNDPQQLKQFQDWLEDYLKRHPGASDRPFDLGEIQRMQEDLKERQPLIYSRIARLERLLGARRGRPRDASRRPAWAEQVMEWAQSEVLSDPDLFAGPQGQVRLENLMKRIEQRMREPESIAAEHRATWVERYLNPESPDSPFSTDSPLGRRFEGLLEYLAGKIQGPAKRLRTSATEGLVGAVKQFLGVVPASGIPGDAPPATAVGGGPVSDAAAWALALAVGAILLGAILRGVLRTPRRGIASFPRPRPGTPIRTREDLVEAFRGLSAFALQERFPPLTHVEIEAGASGRHPAAAGPFRTLARHFEIAFYHPDPERLTESDLAEAGIAYRAALEAIR